MQPKPGLRCQVRNFIQRIDRAGLHAAGAGDDTEWMPSLQPVLLNRLPKAVERHPEVLIHCDPSDALRSKPQKLDGFLNAAVHLCGGIEAEFGRRAANAPS